MEGCVRMKVSIIIPVYFNEHNLIPLYNDIYEKVIARNEFDYEIVMVNDGSADDSWNVMKELHEKDPKVKIISLSRNFGSHAAILCGLAQCTGDCAVIKAADLQEPTELIIDMVKKWQDGYNVVLAVRSGRKESAGQKLFANLYYWMTRKAALPNMPKGGFDVYLIDRKVITTILSFDEKNSALTGQILWSGYRTALVSYERKAREIGTSKWTLAKKIRLVKDTLFSFSALPIAIVSGIGFVSFLGGIIWAIYVFVAKLLGKIPVSGWTTLFIFNLLSFGIIMLTLGILGEYLWRTFDASRKRPPYIIEDVIENENEEVSGRLL